jgi:hypothetical protein
MRFSGMFSSALAAANNGPPPTLSPHCTSTISVSLPAVTTVNSITLTYRGPFDRIVPTPLTTTTAYTVVIPNRCQNGELEARTYTIIGALLGESSSQLPGSTRIVTAGPSTVTVTSTKASPAVTVTAQCPSIPVSSDNTQVRLFQISGSIHE